MNDRHGGLPALLALLLASGYWGFVWYPVRLLEDVGMGGLWQVLTSYGSALVVLTLVRGMRLRTLTGHVADCLWLILAAGWTNVAFLLAVIDGEVVRVLILFYLSPLWAALLGRWLLGEPLGLHTAAMLILGLTGTVVMLWQPAALESGINRADWLGLSAGFAFALANVMTRRLRALGDVLKTQLSWIGVVAVSLSWLLLEGASWPRAPAVGWLGAIGLGVFGFLFMTLAVVYAVSRMPVQRSSVIMLFEIVVGAVSAWWLAGEAMGWREWLGGLMIVGAGLIAVYHASPGETHEH